MRGLTIAAGVAAGLFLAYCIYFDHKRRSHPDFKKKLLQRRKEAKERRKQLRNSIDFSDPATLQSYFVKQVTLGEQCVAAGDFVGAADHLSNAVIVCASPESFLNILKSTCAEDLYEMVLCDLAEKQDKMPADKRLSLVEEDVE